MKQPLTSQTSARYTLVAFTPKGGCPLKPSQLVTVGSRRLKQVAFTPKGGCPLKPQPRTLRAAPTSTSSIHPQGWVPVETSHKPIPRCGLWWTGVAFTPKGGCPLKRAHAQRIALQDRAYVAFTPKGGCPLKRFGMVCGYWWDRVYCSIHPQGWVPVETYLTVFFKNRTPV